MLYNYFNNYKLPIVFCIGCSYTNIGNNPSADYGNWPESLAEKLPNYNVVNLGLGASSVHYAVTLLNKILKLYPKNKFKYKTIIQFTTPYRFTPIKNNNIINLFSSLKLHNNSINYAVRNDDIVDKAFTTGNINQKNWKKHWWVSNYLNEYSDEYIEQDYIGNCIIGSLLSDFSFFWKKSNFELQNLNNSKGFINEFGEEYCKHNFCIDQYSHFNKHGANKVADWIIKEAKWIQK